jgi:hypothetical protein
MALVDDIEELVRRNLGLTDIDLVRMLHGRGAYQQQVNSICRHLVAEGRLERQGRGGWQHPFTYYPRGSNAVPRSPKGEKRPVAKLKIRFIGDDRTPAHRDKRLSRY